MAEQASLMSRRNILLGMAGGAAVAGGITVKQTGDAGTFADLLKPAGLGRRGVNLANGTKDDWALQVGTSFTAHTGHVLKLVDVQAFPTRARLPAGLRPGAFVARFDITHGSPFAAAQLLTVNHNEGGKFPIFLTPGSPSRPMRKLAVFG